jgi:hypothetical protein
VHADLLFLERALLARETDVSREIEVDDLRRHAGGPGTPAEELERAGFPAGLLGELAPRRILGIFGTFVADETRGRHMTAASTAGRNSSTRTIRPSPVTATTMTDSFATECSTYSQP